VRAVILGSCRGDLLIYTVEDVLEGFVAFRAGNRGSGAAGTAEMAGRNWPTFPLEHLGVTLGCASLNHVATRAYFVTTLVSPTRQPGFTPSLTLHPKT
jgi:hypothetical protein